MIILKITILVICLSGLIGLYHRIVSIRRHQQSPTDAYDRESAFARNCKLKNLSGRETEVARMILLGATYKMVAERLYISEKTVDSHIQNIYGKTGVRNKLGLYQVLYRDCP